MTDTPTPPGRRLSAWRRSIEIEQLARHAGLRWRRAVSLKAAERTHRYGFRCWLAATND